MPTGAHGGLTTEAQVKALPGPSSWARWLQSGQHAQLLWVEVQEDSV